MFVPDPQYLGYVTPRLSDVAESITHDYEENAEYVKLLTPEGEIDIVVGKSLTQTPFEEIALGSRLLKVETSGEILAKKMWHRGDRAKARDLFDLCAIAHYEPDAIDAAVPFMLRHAGAFLSSLEERRSVHQAEFEQIDALDFKPSFRECLECANAILLPLTSNAHTIDETGTEIRRPRRP